MGVKGHSRTAPAKATTNPPLSNEGDSVVLSCDLNGNLRSLSRPYNSQIGRAQQMSPTGAMIFEQTEKEVGGGFAITLDSVAWTSAASGTGAAVTVANSLCTLTSGTANSGNAYIQTATKARFHFASANLMRGTWRLVSTDGPQTTRQWGAFNFASVPAIQDGFFFSYDGSSQVFSVNIANGGVITTIKSGSFNGEVSTYVLDSMAHNYEIMYQQAQAIFFVDGVMLHKARPTTAPFTGNMALAASSVCLNSASGTTSAGLEVWAQSIVRLGGVPPAPQFINISTLSTTVVKLGPGTLHAVVINAIGSGANVTTLFDNTAASGTIIGAISTTGSVTTLTYDVDFQNGLTVTIAGGSAANITVVYD